MPEVHTCGDRHFSASELLGNAERKSARSVTLPGRFEHNSHVSENRSRFATEYVL